jgi:ERCC4-type nuclease
VDSREQRPYQFATLKSDAYYNNVPILVNTVVATLKTGDYSIQGHDHLITIERKSKADFFGSIGKRENFEARLERMTAIPSSHIVVEAEWSEIFSTPPRQCKISAKVITRTVISWSSRYQNVRWWFMPSRQIAEAFTFRLTENYYRHYLEAEGNGRRDFRPVLQSSSRKRKRS